MRTIFKYSFDWKMWSDGFYRAEVELPVGAEIIKISQTHLWAIVEDTVTILESRYFALIGTGRELSDDMVSTNFLDTVFDFTHGPPPFMWHIFETKQ